MNEKELFEFLSTNEHGKNLVVWLQKEVQRMCDVRNIKEINETELMGAKKAAEIIDKLVQKIDLKNKWDTKQTSEFE